jgi:hypothetical protein
MVILLNVTGLRLGMTRVLDDRLDNAGLLAFEAHFRQKDAFLWKTIGEASPYVKRILGGRGPYRADPN